MNEPMISLTSAPGEAPVRRFAPDASERPIVPDASPQPAPRRAPLWALLLGLRAA